MANPRVFVSSTCYDLSEVRDSLVEFIRSFGFEPVLSDRGDVFYHPDIHTHDSCLNEISNCQLMILIIGGRFGGEYKSDPEKSIVNAEYAAAREHKIPVFTFVKRSVHSDHFVYSKNKNSDSLANIIFPSIEGNKNAEKIFKFIDQVRSAEINNGFFPFDFAKEITSTLRKQWSGMFYELLEQRTVEASNAANRNLLNNISEASDKVEELVKKLLKQIDTAGADATIEGVEQDLAAKRFYESIYYFLSPLENRPKINVETNPAEYDTWIEYLAAATEGKVVTSEFDSITQNRVKAIVWDGGSVMFEKHFNNMNETRQMDSQFKIVQRIPADLRRDAIMYSDMTFGL